ncbi:MAG: hypothetical protein L0H23_07675 [Luteimonas sp.]|nr:hypothetical protein [Luteimonas sp.]
MTNASLSFPRDTANAGDSAMPPLAAWLLGALFLGAVAMFSLSARAAGSATFGWMPLWLLGMPLTSPACGGAGRAPRRRVAAWFPRARACRVRPETPVVSRQAPYAGVRMTAGSHRLGASCPDFRHAGRRACLC